MLDTNALSFVLTNNLFIFERNFIYFKITTMLAFNDEIEHGILIYMKGLNVQLATSLEISLYLINYITTLYL